MGKRRQGFKEAKEMEERIVYFVTAGKENTLEVLRLVKERALASIAA
jgi:hypothetical protein